MRDNDWTKILGWPGYRVYRAEIDEAAKALKLWVRRKPGNRRIVCSGCGRRVSEIREVYEKCGTWPALSTQRRWCWKGIGYGARTAG